MRWTAPALLTVLALAAVTPAARAAEPAKEDDTAPSRPLKDCEFLQMLTAILSGSQMGPGEGWFHPGQTRYGWPWLAREYDLKPDGALPRERFKGPAELFARLDRNRDGVLTADDFDWSDGAAFVRQMNVVGPWFRRADADGDGKLTREEWQKVFDRLAGDRDHVTAEDVRAMLFPPPGGGFRPGDGPSMAVLLRGLFLGEIGSPGEGPALNEEAPDFALKTSDGKRTVRLSDLRGKPVVLMFGNFSCGPFRSQVPPVEALKTRYGDRVEFVGVYVREAHPTDGWRMASNDKVGVSVKQPRTLAQREEVAGQCVKTLKVTMPLLVDDVDDRVGHAYSGMPARLYLIDPDGKVAYKAGRGPFGLKPGELEQSIALLLAEIAKAAGAGGK
jgi:thiol-disulfide isomerase/thioredoxin